MLGISSNKGIAAPLLVKPFPCVWFVRELGLQLNKYLYFEKKNTFSQDFVNLKRKISVFLYFIYIGVSPKPPTSLSSIMEREIKEREREREMV